MLCEKCVQSVDILDVQEMLHYICIVRATYPTSWVCRGTCVYEA